MTDQLRKIYIEPTSRCNLACTMCFRNTWLDEPFADMSPAVFDNVLKSIPQSVDTVFFGGMGEPLCHPHIISMIERLSTQGYRIELLTNGTLLSKETSGTLLDAGLQKLWVSVDSFDADSYAHIRQNSNFSLIKANLSRFNQERARRENAAQLGLAFVAMKSNVGQLGALAKFAQDYNVSDVNVSNVIPTNEQSLQESLYERVLSLELQTPDVRRYYPTIHLPTMDAQIPDVRTGLLGLFSTDVLLDISGTPVFRQRKHCRFIAEGHTFVRHDGDVSPCMALLHSAATYLDGQKRQIYHHSFGNMNSDRLDRIWNSEDYTAFRKRVRNFEFSPCIACGGCDNRDDNRADCLGNPQPTCGACLWSEGIISCP